MARRPAIGGRVAPGGADCPWTYSAADRAFVFDGLLTPGAASAAASITDQNADEEARTQLNLVGELVALPAFSGGTASSF